MSVHLIATEGAGWLHTWIHPSLNDATNTSLSLDHITAELFADLIIGLILYRPGRWLWNRWHARHDATAHNAHMSLDYKIPTNFTYLEMVFDD